MPWFERFVNFKVKAEFSFSVIKDHAMKTLGEWKYSAIHPYLWPKMVVSCQFHTLVT